MMPKINRGLFLLFAMTFMAKSSISAIYRPTNIGELIDDIQAANASQQDDIIDLEGRIITATQDCDLEDEPGNVGSCSTDFSALPDIVDTSTGGRLAIINGVIERDGSLSNDADDAANVENFRLIEVLANADLTLYNITLRNGSVVDLSSDPTDSALLSAKKNDDVKILATSADDGGAIYNAGTLSLQNSYILDCVADESGGAIYNASGASLSIQSSIIRNNLARNNEDTANNEGGGAIHNAGTITAIYNSTLDGNTSKGNGGAITNFGTLHQLFNSTVSNNTSCSEDIVGGNCPNNFAADGGGIYNDNSASLLQIINSTVANNGALYGGGIYNDSEAAPALVINDDITERTTGTFIHNSTIANNTASEDGGGIYNVDDTSDGATTDAAVITEIISSIVANNVDNNNTPTISPDIFDGAADNITTETHNLIGNNSGNFFVNGNENNIVGTNAAPVDPKLDEDLEFNEGFTSTLALLPGSPAINQGLNEEHKLDHDQRMAPFNRVMCSRPDIGAYELQRCFN